MGLSSNFAYKNIARYGRYDPYYPPPPPPPPRAPYGYDHRRADHRPHPGRSYER